jgi:6-phosphogluconolactonase (cycloisomerase 2 family)
MTKGHGRHVSAIAHISVLLMLVWMVGCGGSTSNSSNNNSGSNGSGTPTAGTSNPGGGGSTSSATYVYVGDGTQGGGASGFKLDGSGNLAAVTGSPFKIGGSSDASYGPLAVANGYVYVSTFSSNGEATPGQLFTFQIDSSTGALTQKGGGVPVTGTSFTAVKELIKSKDGSNLYVLTQSTVTAVATNNGSPTVLNMQDLGEDIWGLAAGNGALYAGIQNGNPKNGFQTPVIKRVALGSNGSVVDAGQTVVTLNDANIPMDLAEDAAGKFLAVTTGMNDNAVSMYAIGAEGSLTPVAGSPFTQTVGIGQKLRFDPSGKFLYEVINEEAVPNRESLIVFSVGSNGALTRVQTQPLPSNVRVSGLVVTDGFVLVSNQAVSGLTGTVTVLSRDSSTGKVAVAGSGTANTAVGQMDVTGQ